MVSRRGVVWLVAAGLVGCGTAGRQPSLPPQPAAACVIGDGAAAATVSIATGQQADPAHAPAPQTPAERLLFRQVYETLVRIDCAGTTLPGLAESWSADEPGHAWQFRLRAGAVFSDGAPVTARAVVESWSATPHSAARVSATFASVTAVGERDLRVELRAPARHPYVFAHPDLAVARRAAGAAWPIGSAAFRIDSSTDARVTRLARRDARASAPATIEFRSISGTDPRAALDVGVDALVIADRAAVEYARALPGYTVTALPWSRTYTLAARVRGGPADTLMGPPADALLALARDAVPAGTRAAEPPFWWRDPECAVPVPAPPTRAQAHAGARTVLYPRGDAVARGIAERLVALAWPITRAPAWLRALLPGDYAAAGAPIAAAVDERAVLDSLRAGRGLAFVVPLPRGAAAACAASAPGDAALAFALTGTDEWRITPLLDAHDYFVHRKDFGRFTVESDGTIRFGGGEP